MKIVLLDASTLGNIKGLEQLSQFGEVVFFDTTSRDEVFERVKDAEIILTNKVVIDKDVMSAAPNLKLISVLATGVNIIDLEEADKRNIKVKNVAGYSTNSVAQQTFSLLFALTNKVSAYDQYVKSGEYSKSSIFTNLNFPFWEINGKRFGIIGLGAIGQKVAQIATAFGAEVVYFSASGKNNNQTYQRLELNALLETSDVVSIHAPLNEFTKMLLNYDELSKMKSSALLINVGRGGIVNEHDLHKILIENKIAGAALDVFEKEPIIENHILLDPKIADKLVFSPHIAWASIEARQELWRLTIQNIKEFCENI